MSERHETGDVASFNALAQEEAAARLTSCLGARRWVDEVLAGRPYADLGSLLTRADVAARELTDEDLDQALAGHPRIGERAGQGHDAAFSAQEQSGVEASGPDVGARLIEGNRAYESRFGRVFLIRAAGREAQEILTELERRLHNDPGTERQETVDNLREIALLRLELVI
ncbi:2-oxo-4-hydroxy-4-carboxy-5-ureidoimidazoline decarboxylase [Aeromicrobium sp.]|uniref:2-oxo-4-hydroxy-4-carboxy-5-ureidoimidazoline decarboxylase n=1 Tax=Aeromicrobium sp. TaxID=1871063 RepID=UPI0030C3FB3E